MRYTLLSTLFLSISLLASAQQAAPQPRHDHHFQYQDDEDNPCRVFIGVRTARDSSSGGAAIIKTFDNTPASRAGLVVGDILMAINGIRVQDAFDILRERDKCKIGDYFTMTVRRNGTDMQIREQFRPCSAEDQERMIAKQEQRLEKQLKWERLEKQLERERLFQQLNASNQANPCNGEVSIGGIFTYNYHIAPRLNGVLVLDVKDNTPASRCGLKKDDVVLRFDNKPVDSHEALIRERNQHKPGDDFTMTVLREGKTFDVTGRFDACTTPPVAERHTPIAAENAFDIQVAPNPVIATATVQWTATANGTCEVQVADISGKIIYQRQVNAAKGPQSHTIDLSDAASGVYIVTIKQANNVASRQIVK